MSNKIFKSYKEQSRNNWGREADEDKGLSIEQINCGAILRIADATESMAQNHVKLLNDLAWYKDLLKSSRERVQKLERSNSALRGVITKLKNKQS